MNFNEFLNEKYTKDDINTLYGFYGAMEDEHNEKIADELFDAAVKDLMKEFGLKENEAVSLLNSKAGRQAADAMIAGECEDSVIAGMYWYFGKNKAKVVNFAKKTVSESEELDEAKKDIARYITLAQTKKVAETLAKAISKADGVKCTVNQKSLEEASFDLDVDGEEYAGGSYVIYTDGNIVNHAVTPNEIYGDIDSSVEDFIKGLKKPIKESEEISESRITLKRQYTENYPAKTVGKHAAIRNKIIEALKDGELTKEEFDNLVSGLTEDSKRWLRRNAEFFNIQEDKVGLTKAGQRILKSIDESGYRPMSDEERAKKQYKDQQLARLRAADKKEAEKKRLLALQQKMHQAKLKKANENNNINMENKFIYESFSDFVNSKNQLEESFNLVTESFKSSMLAGLFMRSGKFDASLAKAFYGATKLKLDQIEDEDLLTVSPDSAYKNKQDGTIVFYISDTEKPNPHAPSDAYYTNKTIPGEGYLLAVTSGDNKFYDNVWVSYRSGSRDRTLRTVDNNPSDSVGIGKKYKGWDATGLYNVKRISEVADRAIIVNVALLSQKYSASNLRSERAAAKKGAIAFKTDKDFKAENMARYRSIIAQKVAEMPLDSLVAKAIETMSEQIKTGLDKKEKGRYGEFIVGTNAKGSEAKLSDVAYHMRSILDEYQRYVGVAAQQEASIARYGEAESWYKKELEQQAVKLKEKLDQVNSFSYVW